MGFSSSKTDSIFLAGKYVGTIDSISAKDWVYTSQDGKETNKKTITYRVSVDDFITKTEKKEIEKIFGGKPGESEFIFIDRFSTKSKIEIAGYYTKKSGELMNSRNNWRLIGASVATVVILISPPSLALYTTASVIVGVSSVVSLVKDYKANSMLKKAGDAMMSK